MSGRQRLRVELHCHTQFSSDGMIQFNSLLRTAARRRLDVIAITDHDTIAGAEEFRARAKRTNSQLQIIVGEERTLANGAHLIGLFLHHAISSTSLLDVVAEVREQGGICVIPHPFRSIAGLLTATPEPRLDNVCFELFNAKCCAAANAAAGVLVARNWIPVGGSDAHVEADLGKSVNLIPWDVSVENSIRAALSGFAPVAILGVSQKPNRTKTWRDFCRETAYRMYRRASNISPKLARSVYRNARNAIAPHDLSLELKSSGVPNQVSAA